ncbi:MAG: Re/Si-specific NAD(P)(+) transhydrogenase subunit alpha [Myxococcota bacterium]
MIVGVPKESFPGETRVALVPGVLKALSKAKVEVVVEAGAGVAAGYPDAAYEELGAKILPNREAVFEAADIVAQVRTLGANLDVGAADLALMREGQLILGLSDPLSKTDAAAKLAEKGVTLVGMELIPRITRAQSMDALSSMATVAGYRAVLLAANHLPKLFPMMMTAAGTLAATKAFVIGAGVAGLQACATAKRLGAVVKAYDVRAAVKDQVISVGAKFVELPVEAGDAEDKGGYAKALGEDFYRRQRELMTEVIAESDVVITTAAIPGKKSPVLVTAEMVEKMPPGSVIVDLAAERGGNCELTKADEVVHVHGVTILGPTNIVTGAPYHASQMYGKNVVTLLAHLIKDGQLELDMSDEITQGVVMTKDKEIVHAKVREILGLSELAKPAEEVKA